MLTFIPINKVLLFIPTVLCWLILWGCAEKEQEKERLSAERFSAILLEFYLSEAKLNGLAISRDSAALLFIPREDTLMKRFGVSDSVLLNTYQYYFDHPQEFEKIYDVVIDSLNLREKKEQTKPVPIN